MPVCVYFAALDANGPRSGSNLPVLNTIYIFKYDVGEIWNLAPQGKIKNDSLSPDFLKIDAGKQNYRLLPVTNKAKF